MTRLFDAPSRMRGPIDLTGADDAGRIADEAYDGAPPIAVAQLANLAQVLRAHPRQPRAVAFVASRRGEGASTCLAHVARHLAQQRSRVLIVDANFPYPALHAIAGVDVAPGLVDVLAGDIDARSALQPTMAANLYVLASGEREPSGTNRLVLPALFRDRVLDPTRDFDFVLVDCPALSCFEDAAVVAAGCDASLLVVEGGRTQKQEAQAAKTLLMRARCEILGVFMNKRKHYIPRFLYERL
jgi:protein-tyrosine kinase